MRNMDEIIYYIPTEEEKVVISKKTGEIINILSGLSIAQKAFALRVLVETFEETTGASINKTELH